MECSANRLQTARKIFEANGIDIDSDLKSYTDGGCCEDICFNIFLKAADAGLICQHYYKEIGKIIADSRKKIALLGTAAVVAALLLANFLAAVVSRPIRSLTEATRRVAPGERNLAVALLKKKRIVGVIESIQDITEQKAAEQESLNLQNQLVQAQKMESIGRLAGGVAHDFNNILSVIIGYSELCLATLPGDHPLQEKLRIIEDSGKKAAALIRQLLAFSRKQILEMTVLQLNDVVENMMKMN